MKKFLVFTLLLNSSLLFSQLKMQGKVTDSLNKPLELANIILINSETNALESYAISDHDGEYKVSLKKNSSYNLQVSYIGMASYSKLIKTQDSDISKDFILYENNELDAVELTYVMPVVIKGDTLVYDADSFKTGT